MAPFGPKLGQNDAPDLRIILDRFLDPKTQFKNKRIQIFLRVGGMRRSLVNPPRYVCTGNGVLGYLLYVFLQRYLTGTCKETLRKRTHFSEYSLGDTEALKC